MTYDEIGNIVSQATATGVREYSYLIDGSVRTISDERGTSAHFRCDALGAVGSAWQRDCRRMPPQTCSTGPATRRIPGLGIREIKVHSMTTNADIDFEAIREQWTAAGSESDLGLWWLADDIRDIVGGDASEQQVRSITLQALGPLLESGKLRAVDLLEGGKFESWCGDVDEQLERITDAWRAIGKPDIGDVVWFIGNRG